MSRVALVFGCPRSGTSILGELIASHPEVRYIFEAHDIWETAGIGPEESHRLTAERAAPEVKRGIRQWFEGQLGEARLLVEKNPRNSVRVPFIREVFPEALLVHIVRDGRDVAASMVPGCGGARWDHLKPPSWRELFRDYQGVVRCALAWKEIVEIALRDLEGIPHLMVRYEDLVRDPCTEARKLMAYLGLEEHPRVVRFCARITDVTRGAYLAGRQDRWYRDDHQVRIGRWKENLEEAEKRTIGEHLAPLLHRLGYE